MSSRADSFCPSPIAGTFGAMEHFDWYHKEREVLFLQRASEARRLDRNGTPIGKAIGRRHKIAFRDQVMEEQGLETVHHVESYKMYNVISKGDGKTRGIEVSLRMKNAHCQCNIF